MWLTTKDNQQESCFYRLKVAADWQVMGDGKSPPVYDWTGGEGGLWFIISGSIISCGSTIEKKATATTPDKNSRIDPPPSSDHLVFSWRNCRNCHRLDRNWSQTATGPLSQVRDALVIKNPWYRYSCVLNAQHCKLLAISSEWERSDQSNVVIGQKAPRGRGQLCCAGHSLLAMWVCQGIPCYTICGDPKWFVRSWW